MTVSFYVKSNESRVHVCEIFKILIIHRQCAKTYTVIQLTWERFSLTFPADTTGKFNDNNLLSLNLISSSLVQT